MPAKSVWSRSGRARLCCPPCSSQMRDEPGIFFVSFDVSIRCYQADNYHGRCGGSGEGQSSHLLDIFYPPTQGLENQFIVLEINTRTCWKLNKLRKSEIEDLKHVSQCFTMFHLVIFGIGPGNAGESLEFTSVINYILTVTNTNCLHHSPMPHLSEASSPV